MHDTFLPSVNAFVVLDGGEALVVDAGTPDPLNDTRLMRALLGLGVDPAETPTTLFCTHAHIDHVGLARELAEAGARVLVRMASSRTCAASPCPHGATRWRPACARRARRTRRPPSSQTSSGTTSSTSRPRRSRSPRWRPGCGAGRALDLRGRGRPGSHGGPVRALGAKDAHGVSRRRGPLPVLHLHRLLGRGRGPDWRAAGDPCERSPTAASSAPSWATACRRSVSERCLANAGHHERRSARALAAIAERPGSTGYELVPSHGLACALRPLGRDPRP